MSNMKNLSDQIDKVFLVAKPAIEDEGEDGCYCCRDGNRAIAAVFDGCGGLGSRRYATYNGHTGAYMSSRIASGVAHDCFHSMKDKSDKSGKAFYHKYLRYLQRSYSKVTEMCSNERSLIRGALVRDFPCTAAIAYVSVEEESVSVDCMWAGDSRVYVLYEKGLLQMTVDDLDVSDAMKNLSADGALTNVISSDGNYEVHGRSLELKRPALIFAATDGCFGYLNSPMEFEYALIGCMMEADGPASFENRLYEVFKQHAQDDFTLGGIVIGFGTFDNMKKNFEERYRILQEKYIIPIKKARDSDSVRNELWEQYRIHYEHYIR